MKNKKGNLKLNICSAVSLFLSLLVTGLVGISKFSRAGKYTTSSGATVTYGFKNSLFNYFRMWKPFLFQHWLAYVGCVIICIAVVALITLVIYAIVKKQKQAILPTIFFSLGLAYLPFLMIYAITMIEAAQMRMLVFGGVLLATGLLLFGMILSGLSVVRLIACFANSFENKLAGVKEEAKEEVKEEVKGLTEEQVREIVAAELAKHEEEKHVEEEKAVAKEEPVKEEKVEEAPVVAEEEVTEVEDEEVEEETSEVEGGDVAKAKAKRVPFEQKLAEADDELKEKFAELQKALIEQGFKERISIPGATYSLHRKRYAFITIVGKRIRLYVCTDPSVYAETTMPIEVPTAKKFEDLPTLLKIKSGLSFRRGLQLISDLASEKAKDEEAK
jgi:hypothetical protein